jgi:plastocyanin
MAWSAGAQLAIPYTPHTLSLHASNVNTGTLQGSSRGAGGVRYGFEFTIPVTLSRYLGRGSQPAVEAAAPAPVPAVDSLAAAAAADSVVADSVVVVQRPDTAAAAPMVAQAPSAPSDTTAAKPEAKTPEAPVKKPAPAPRRTARRASTVAVAIEGFKFVPARLEVAVGTTVVWTNRDQVVHTATADNRSWDSGLIQPGATWRRTFDRPGTYPYHCTPHPFMKGVIVVR